MICYKLLQHPRSVYPWHLDVCKSSDFNDLPTDVSDNGLFQLKGETSCLFRTSI